MQTIRYLSLFSGIGGFELGLDNCRIGSQRQRKGHSPFRCIGFSEIDPVAASIYQHHFPRHPAFGDVEALNIESLPNFDILVGGFPCQSFSMAGLRKGFRDKRGNLFFTIARIVRQKRPRLLLLENVKGLLSHQGGQTFAQILTALDELGYDLQWQVLNSAGFGVPQSRQRVYIAGHLRGTSRPKVFPLERKTGDVCRIVGRVHGIKGHDCLKRVYSPDGASPTLVTNSGGNQAAKFLIDGQIRRLTPLECERVQGFPDGWTEGFSDTQRYRCLGNAVTVPVAAAVAQQILDSAETK